MLSVVTISKKPKVSHYIREWRKHRGLSQEKLAEAVGVTDGAISQVERGDTKYTQTMLEAVAKALDCTPGQLVDSHPKDSDNITLVPLISFVNAGGFCDPGYVDHEADAPKIEVANLPRGKWIALRVEGDSMDRVSPPGSIIIVNTQDKELAPNAFYVVANEAHEATYKRFRPNPDRFEPMSTNPNHEPIFPQGEIKIIGRVKRSILEL